MRENGSEIIFSITRDDINNQIKERKEECERFKSSEEEMFNEIVDTLKNTLDWKDTADQICYLYMEG